MEGTQEGGSTGYGVSVPHSHLTLSVALPGSWRHCPQELREQVSVRHPPFQQFRAWEACSYQSVCTVSSIENLHSHVSFRLEGTYRGTTSGVGRAGQKRGASCHQEISQPPGIVACASARNRWTFDLDVYGRNPKLDCTLYTIPNAHS